MAKSKPLSARDAKRLVNSRVLRNPEQFRTEQYVPEPLSIHITSAGLGAHPAKGTFRFLIQTKTIIAWIGADGTCLTVNTYTDRVCVYEDSICVDVVTAYLDRISVPVWLEDRYGVRFAR